MQQICANTWCQAPFDVTQDDLALLEKASPEIGDRTLAIPPPRRCPACRMQHRLMFRNQQTLYKRTCDATGKPIVSIYSPDKSQAVYSAQEWWKDSWDAMSYGRGYDPQRPFHEQFTELMRAVPHIAVLVTNAENSEYTNQTYGCRDCYLSSAIKDCDGALYVQNANKITDSLDSSFCFRSELLYECTDSYDCYGCTRAEHCFSCTDCSFVYDCIGCMNCFGCIGLRQQQFHFFNVPCSKEEYARKLQEYARHTYDGYRRAAKAMEEFLQANAHEHVFLRNCENVTGNNVQNSRNCLSCHDSLDLEDCRYSTWVFGCKDVMDCYGMGDSQLVYDCVGVEEVQRVAFSFGTSSSQNCCYTDLCFHCTDCFGCVGLRKKQYCVLNKQYSRDEYAAIVPQIVDDMKRRGTWGEFFPASVSAFAYNESKAGELFPLAKQDALARGYAWKDDIDEMPQAEKVIPSERLPQGIAEIPDDILQWALLCEETRRPFKITKKELEFYRQRGLPVPHAHPDVRLRHRSGRRTHVHA